MTVLMAEGWKQYLDRTELGYGWPLMPPPSSGTFADVSGRRALDLAGGRLARVIPARRRICVHVIVDLTAGAIGSGTTLLDLGLHPVAVAAASYTSANNARFSMRIYGPKIFIIRRAFGQDGTLYSNAQTVADITHGMVAGNSYRVELMVDVSGETGDCELMINGALAGEWAFARAIGSYVNDADFGVVSIAADSSSGSRGRISNLVVYDDVAPTAWPAGPLNISYLNAQPNSGESFSFPPAPADVPVSIEAAAGKEWSLTNTSGLTAPAIKGVVGTVRLSAPDALTPAKPQVSWKNGANALATQQLTVQPGTPHSDHQFIIPANDPAALDALTLEVKPW